METGKIKEELSICYLNTISAVNGIAMELCHHDEDSIDAIIKMMVDLAGKRYNSQISVQLKTTSSKSQYSIDEKTITYKLRAKNYNDLCAPSAMPSMLALLVLPENSEEWIDWSEEELMLRGQMFWISLQNQNPTNNTGTVSVNIPLENRLGTEKLKELMIIAAEEGKL